LGNFHEAAAVADTFQVKRQHFGMRVLGNWLKHITFADIRLVAKAD